MISKTIKSKKNKISAGILMYSRQNEILKFLIVHPGGPFWVNKNQGAWTIPKGEVEENNDIVETAKRELFEETGIISSDSLIELGYIKQKGGKTVYAWAFEGELKGEITCTSYCDIEYPIKSGKFLKIPEVDKGGMFTKEETRMLINPAQFEFIEKLEKIINENIFTK
jgi:predicted NUDIX family NTP pyrophosphohydrolase